MPRAPRRNSIRAIVRASGQFLITPMGFFWTLYGLNVVAWGGMLFLLLCGAAPEMCWAPIHTEHSQKQISVLQALSLTGPLYHNCDDINSPRRIWIEIDSQILNALFCVTGLGLIPWRFRDLYHLLRWRWTGNKEWGRLTGMESLRVLAGLHHDWFRLPGSDTLKTESTQDYLSRVSAAPPEFGLLTPEDDPRLPLPISKHPSWSQNQTVAPPTALWKLDFFVWAFVVNTGFQCCLCGCMWGLNRYDRPPWSTGLFVTLACVVAAAGGYVAFRERKSVKKIEAFTHGEMSGQSHLSILEGDDLR